MNKILSFIFYGAITFLVVASIYKRYIYDRRPEVVERHWREKVEYDLERERQIELSEKKRAASSCADFAGTSAFEECFQRELEHVKEMDSLERMMDENPPE